MARGFESKSVEAQQEEAARGKVNIRPQMTPEEQDTEQRRRTLELTRKRACHELSRASASAHRQMLEEAIAALDRQIKDLEV